jgi:RimJ/RimL family protein N-acetyltransferase
MSTIQVRFQPLDLRNATENEYARLSTFKNILNCEYWPDDPPIPLEEHIQGWKNLPQFVEYEAYTVWNETASEIIAYCDIAIYNTGDNEHLAELKIEVLPAHRRKGIGRQALHLLLPFAINHKRTLLTSWVSNRVPAAAIWCERLGARKGLGMYFHQLKLSEFDKTLVQSWLEQSKNKHSEFELGFNEGPYPEDLIDEIAALYQEVANDQPREELEMEDMKFTPEILRQEEQYMFSKGNRRWTLYLRDAANGQVAGLTEVFWNPNRSMILNQGFTGIYPSYRNKGLGRWLKAEMMQKILSERPEVEFVRTGNANSNAAMLKINQEMGFMPYISNTVWQVETARVEKYLNEKRDTQ